MIKVRWIVLVALLTMIIGTVATSFYRVDSGTIAVHKRMGRVIAENGPGGPYFKWPLVDSVEEVSTIIEGNTVRVTGRTSDVQELGVIVSVQWGVAPKSATALRDVDAQKSNDVEAELGDAAKLIITYGSRAKFDENIMDKRITKVVNDFISAKTLEEIVDARKDFTDGIINELNIVLSEYPVLLDSIQVIDIIPSEQYTKAIEEKKLAEIDAAKAEDQKLAIQTRADAHKYKLEQTAEAEAYAIQKRLEAEAEGITKRAEALNAAGPGFIEYARIMQWDGVMPKVIGGNEGVDFGIGASVGKQVADTELAK